MKDEILIVLLVVNLDVSVVGMNAKREVGGEGPWSSRPGKE